MLCLIGFELYSRWVPLIEAKVTAVIMAKLTFCFDSQLRLVNVEFCRLAE